MKLAKRDYDLALDLAPTKKKKTSLQEGLGKRLGNLEKALEQRGKKISILTIPIITLLLISLCFASFSLTGNVIGPLTSDGSRFVGLCMFLCGLVFVFYYFKNK